MAILEAVIDEPEAHLSDYTNFAPAAAMLLLAEFREERAYPLLVEMAQLDADLVDHYFDAKLIDVWPRVLASTSGGDVAGLKTIIENRQAAQWVRSAAVDAMAALMLNDMLHREELIGYFRLLYQEKIDRQSDSIWNSLVPTTLAIHPGELIEEVQTAFEEDLVDAFPVRTRGD